MSAKRNIYLMYLIALLQGMVFYAPIASLYRQAAGLSLSQIALIEGISYLMCFSMELPWGLLADRIGYRRTMIACCVFYFLSKLVFWRASGFFAFLLERFALSVALAGFSGVDQSILYLSCAQGDAQKVFGRYDACSTAGMLLASLAYLLFIGDRYRLAALATMIAYALAALISQRLIEVHNPDAQPQPALRSFTGPLKQILRNRPLLIFIAACALFREAGQMVTVWLSQNQYLRCGMNSADMGAAYIIVSLAMLLSAQSRRLTSLLGERRFAAATLLLAAVGCVCLVFIRSARFSVLCIALVAAARSLFEPLVGSILNARITVSDRATHLSIFALLQHGVAAGAQAVYGRAADSSLEAAFMLCALACLAAFAAFHCFRRTNA